MPTLAKLARWLAGKLAAAGLIVLLALAVAGAWLFFKDVAEGDRLRQMRLDQLGEEQADLRRRQAELTAKLDGFARETERQRARGEQARRVMATLLELESWWDRVFGNTAQQKANAEQVERMRQIHAESAELIATLRKQVALATRDRAGLEQSLARLAGEIRAVEQSRSAPVYYLQRAWQETRWTVAAVLVAFLAGPTVWALLMYYGFAPLAGRGRPIRLAESAAAAPAVGESRVSIAVPLRGGDVLRVKEKFLQASDEAVARSTRFVLDWRIPFTSLACGLVELVELRAGPGPGERQVTLSNADDPHVELAALDLPEGSSLVLRPRFLAAVIVPAGVPLRIRRHWQLARWQSWVAGQFRFFEFVGPCRLVVAGSRGVRAESLAAPPDAPRPARRVNQDATIGFTPHLAYRPVRAETFWSYYRGMNPLFDDIFAGPGMFLLQETSTPDSAARAGRFWSGVWSGVLKVFGL